MESYASKDNGSIMQPGLNSDFSTPNHYDFTLHQGDLCFIPRGWSYQFQLTSTGGIDSSSVADRLKILKNNGFSNEEGVWPRQEWEPSEASLDEVAARVSRSPGSFEVGEDDADDGALPFMVLRHYYKGFPVLTEQEAAL